MKLAEDLKKAVLQAAMQGKLTKQLESDSNIFELLKTVEQTKKQLLERKEIKLEKFDDQVGDYDIPKNWAVVKLGTISGVITKQTGFDYTSHIKPFLVEEHKEDTIPMVQTKNFKGKKFDLETDYYIPLSIAENFPKIVLRGKCLLFSIVGASIGNVGLYDSDVLAMIGGAICKVSLIDPCFYDYLFYYLQSHEGYKQIMKNYKSTAQGTITVQDVREIDVLLPPIEEQQRIVEKLNQILPLIDEYGKEEDELITLCQKFPEEMKKSVLQSAMQGKLTKQLETDSSVDEMISSIQYEARLENCSEKLILDAMDFTLPDNWRFIKLNEIVRFVDYRGKTPHKINKGVFLITASNIKQGFMDYTRKEYISEEEYLDRMSRGVTRKGDLLFTTEAPMGNASICNLDKTSCGQRIITFQKYSDHSINLEYLMFCILSPDFQAELLDNATGTTAKGIKGKKLKHLLLPLPPIEEQQRIVEKLNTILPIIDSMSVYGTKKKAGRPKQEEALAFISSLLGTNKFTDSKSVSPEITELTSKAKVELPAIVQKYADLMGVTYNRITIRHQKTRWGSCTKTGNLSFNCLIMKMPETVRDYVIVHELAHRKELNHSTKFWTIVSEYCPWYKDSKQWLKDNGSSLLS